jgi:hypothetical protein
VDQACEYCDHPDSSLLRVVLIGEILRADDRMLYTLAEVCETIGLMQLSDEEQDLSLSDIQQRVKRSLRLVK